MFEWTLYWTGVFFVFGLLLGSFANVVIWRLPKGENVAWPGSTCPQCSTPIKWYDNVPVLSWMILRGKCRSCRAKISSRYPLVELLTGTLFALAFWQMGWTWTLVESLILLWGLVCISFIDLDHMIIPDKFTYPGMIIGLIGGALNPDRSFSSAAMGLLFGGGFLLAVAYIYALLRKKEGMGGGDIKLLGWIGAVLGIGSIPFVILASSVFGSLVGLLIVARSKSGMQAVIPFGPYIAVAAIAYMLFGGEEFSQWYFSLFHLEPLLE